MASLNPYWARDPQFYEVDQERWRHDEALYGYGEYAIFVLLWRPEDFDAGLVAHCPVCYVSYGSISDAYGQTADPKCRACFGSTFDGGYKAKIVRPSIWDFGADTNKPGAKGEVILNTAQIQSTTDFRMRVGDFAFKGDGTRWRIENISVTRLRSGFETPVDSRSLIAYSGGQVVREDKTSVAYDIAPLETELKGLLDTNSPRRYPTDFSSVEVLRSGATLL